MATYLSIVNSILVRLRENTVGNVTDTAYSTLIGQFVNDAKREVEDSWQWSSLLDYVDVPVIAGTSVYNLNSLTTGINGANLNERARVRVDLRRGSSQVYITTPTYENNLRHYQFDTNEINRAIYANNSMTNVPTGFALTPLPSASWVDGKFNRNFNIYTPPSVNLTIRAWFTNPQNNLVNNTDVMMVPEAPVSQRAYLFALWERGEELGEALTLTTIKANAALQDAIGHDQNNQSHESGFFVDSYNPAPVFFQT